MKVIDTKGITYLQEFENCREWYWGTDYACGDLYEAEDVFLAGERFEPNRLIFAHYPDGRVYEPIQKKELQYFGDPICIGGVIYFLLAAFDEKMLRVYRLTLESGKAELEVELSLGEVKNCYNLKLDGSPLAITRQGEENRFQFIWPKKAEFAIGERESFLLRQGNKLYFGVWHEDPDYREEVNVREYPTGRILETIPGTVKPMPNGEPWIIG